MVLTSLCTPADFKSDALDLGGAGVVLDLGEPFATGAVVSTTWPQDTEGEEVVGEEEDGDEVLFFLLLSYAFLAALPLGLGFIAGAPVPPACALRLVSNCCIPA